MYLIRQLLQRIQNAAARFLLKKYAKMNGVISLQWLPLVERIEYNVAKMAYTNQ